MIGHGALTFPSRPRWNEVLSALVQERVRFLIVGSVALHEYVRERVVNDLDVWIDATPENAIALARAVAIVGVGATQFEVEERTGNTPDQVTQLEMFGLCQQEYAAEYNQSQCEATGVTDLCGRNNKSS